ncbi:MAG: aldehyde dehydrogenase family protein [Deltaproteobacteria bacterium]|nr:aldehyde dehydrogenase family protein [Deltaproteobacteria bacterium]
MSDFTLTIGGHAVAAQQTFGVIDPATEEVFAQAPDASKEDLDAAVRAANEAFPAWRDTPLEDRRAALAAMADRVEAEAPALADLLVHEQGKSLANAQFEVIGTAMWLRATAATDLPTEVLSETETQRVELRRRALGVVGAITPWNFPLLLSIWKVGPALVTGNTMVLKPSPYTPLAVLRFGEIVREVLPPGVLNVVSGGDDLGRWITEHPDVHKISFTGSGPTGKRIMSSASGSLKRITLELGGNDAAIVRGDADPSKVAGPIFDMAFQNSGQVCGAIKRLYVHEDIYEDVCDALVETANSKTVGSGMEPGVDYGPVQNRMQYERVCELAESAREAGGRFLVGGEPREGKGYFFPITLVADLTDGTRLVDEEPFGPILPIIRFRDDEDVLRRANDTSFGLGGSVWSADVERATEMAGQLETGSAWVNQHFNLSPFLPFGGVKESGMGVENGPWGMAEFTSAQVLNIKKD